MKSFDTVFKSTINNLTIQNENVDVCAKCGCESGCAECTQCMDDGSLETESDDCSDAIGMAKTQLQDIAHNVQDILDNIDNCKDVEHWQTAMLAVANYNIDKLKETMLY